jgi:hypothetical protein
MTGTPEEELALKRYTPVLAYLATECTMFWNRSQLFLVAHSALIGFVAKDIPTRTNNDPANLRVPIALSIAGLVLSGLWHLAIFIGSRWIDWWKAKLIALEQEAFGTTHLWRSRPSTPVHARTVARLAAWLFTVLWLGLLVYLIWLAMSCG